MDVVVRGWRLLLIGLAACAAHPAEPVGVSTGGRSTPIAQDAGPPSHPLTVVPPDFRAKYVKVAAVPRSEHALGRFEVDVLAADQATADSLRAATDPAVGAIVVGDHREKAGGAQGPVYVMKKEASGWRFYASDEKGETLIDEHTAAGARDACASCHAEAPHDGIFLPR
jgi:hypothetical protein